MSRHDNTSVTPVRVPGGGHRGPKLFTIAFGMVDSRLNGIDYFDTVGGEELKRLYRQRQSRRHPGRRTGPSAARHG